MWHIRSQFIANNNNNSECIRSLKEDLIDCFFKCRTYELITLTEEEFKYFYIDKIKICADYLDLQIACIYIYTLPNGIAEIVGEIFKSPLQSLLTLKVFALYIVVLLSAFCSF